MMFINSRLQQEKPYVIPYVLLKLHGEKFVNPGLDESGRAQHWRSLFGTIRVAGQIMPPQDLYEFLKDLEAHERTGFFQLDGEVRDFMNRCQGNVSEGKRKYLDSHYHNKWVFRGRNEEFLASLGLNSLGFRNHAEAIYSSLRDLDLKNMYLASAFVHSMAEIEQDTPVLVQPPYNSFAYAMTKKGNGITDLVIFDPAYAGTQEDIIKKIPNKGKTWTALSKRLSYGMHVAEKEVQQLISQNKKSLDGLLIEAGQKDSAFKQEIALIESLVTSRPFEETRLRLAQLPSYQKELTRIEELSAQIASTLSRLEGLAGTLRQQI